VGEVIDAGGVPAAGAGAGVMAGTHPW